MAQPVRWLFGICLLVSLGCGSRYHPPAASPPETDGPTGSTAFVWPGIRTPATEAADTVELPDDTPVIGVVVNGEARAYVVKALSTMYSHVINDVVANVPVTVTYCDKTDCARVFTDESRGQPLEIDLGGFDRGMLLRFDGDFYRQQEGVTIRPNADDRFPFPTLPFERMTWLVWKKRHPNSRVFKGVAPVPDTHRARPEEAGD